MYVFTRSGAVWTLQQTLTAGDAAAKDRFGYSVAISGGAILVGAPECTIGSALAQGAVYAFTSDGTTWTQQQKFTSSDGSQADAFGKDVAMDGDTALIGASFKMVGAGLGAAYVFTRSGATWSQQQQLTAADGAGERPVRPSRGPVGRHRPDRRPEEARLGRPAPGRRLRVHAQRHDVEPADAAGRRGRRGG